MVKNIISVFIGSKNPTKINAVKKAFTCVFKKKHFSFIGVSSPSGVGDQPMSEKETKRGAKNRLFYLKENFDGDLSKLSSFLNNPKDKNKDYAGAIELIRSLNPKPGSIISASLNQYHITPDIIITKKDGKWITELNPSMNTKIKINQDYKKLTKKKLSIMQKN